MDDLALSRIFLKLDELDVKIDKLCEWKTEMKKDWDNHIKDIEDRQNKKLRRRDFTIVLFGLGITFVEVLRSLGII